MLLIVSSVIYDNKHGHVLLILMGKNKDRRSGIHTFQRSTLPFKDCFKALVNMRPNRMEAVLSTLCNVVDIRMHLQFALSFFDTY